MIIYLTIFLRRKTKCADTSNKPIAPHKRRHITPAASSLHDLDSQQGAASQALAPQSLQAQGEVIHNHTSSIHDLPPHTKHHRCCNGRSGAGSLHRIDLQRVVLALAPKTLPLQRPHPRAAHVAKCSQNIATSTWSCEDRNQQIISKTNLRL